MGLVCGAGLAGENWVNIEQLIVKNLSKKDVPEPFITLYNS